MAEIYLSANVNRQRTVTLPVYQNNVTLGGQGGRMKKEYLNPNFIGPILPPENLTEEQKAAVVKVILRYSGNSLIYVTDLSQDASETIAN